MKTQHAINYFGSATELANRCRVTKQAIQKWKKMHYPPLARQYQIQVLTGGDLIVTHQEAE